MSLVAVAERKSTPFASRYLACKELNKKIPPGGTTMCYRNNRSPNTSYGMDDLSWIDDTLDPLLQRQNCQGFHVGHHETLFKLICSRYAVTTRNQAMSSMYHDGCCDCDAGCWMSLVVGFHLSTRISYRVYRNQANFNRRYSQNSHSCFNALQRWSKLATMYRLSCRSEVKIVYTHNALHLFSRSNMTHLFVKQTVAYPQRAAAPVDIFEV